MSHVELRNETGISQRLTPPGIEFPLGQWVRVPLRYALGLVGQPGFAFRFPPDAGFVYREEDGVHLLWASPLSTRHSYGIAGQNTLQALLAAGVQAAVRRVWRYDRSGLKPTTVALAEMDSHERLHQVGVCLAPPDFYNRLPTPFRVGWAMFETTDPWQWHPDWPQMIDERVHLLLVPSAWLVEVFGQAVSVPVEVVPLGIDYETCQPLERPERETFTTVTWGYLTDRKGPRETVEVFERAFPPDRYPHCRLALKNVSAVTSALGLGGPPLEIDDPRIVVHQEQWSAEEMRAFWREADAAIFLTKGEGFGLPAREAIAVGLPTVLSQNSGHLEVCDRRHNWPVRCQAVPSPMGGEWWQPDLDQAVDALRWIHDHREKAAQRARKGGEAFIENWGPERIGECLIQAIEKYL